MNIYVGNVPYAATETDLEELFGEYGKIATATIIRDRYDGRSKGFGFVEMKNQEDGNRAIEALDGQEMMGRPLKVNPARHRGRHNEPRKERGTKNNSDRVSESSPEKTQDSSPENKFFHNPYTFVPTPPRPSGGFAGDFNPLEHPLGKEHNLCHSSLKKNLWTGHILIKLTTITPLVLLKDDDSNKRESIEDQTYDVLDYIPESSLRGMLRSAYEVVTNSRYGCFSNDDRLAYRMDARKAVELIPAIIEDRSGGNLVARLYTGTSTPTAKGPDNGDGKRCPMYAAMLTRYNDKKLDRELDKKLQSICDDGYIPKTGDKVWAEIVLCEHDESQKRRSDWNSECQPDRNYQFWKVVKVWPRTKNGQTIDKPSPTEKKSWHSEKPQPDSSRRQSYYAPCNPNNPQRQVVKGRVLITNKNMRGKHDERIFFNPQSEVRELADDVEEAWRMRIKSYREAHPDSEFFGRSGARNQPWKNIGDNPGKTAWSPHQYQDSKHKEIWRDDPHRRESMHDAIELKPGDMVYAHCKFDKDKIVVKDLFPVMISRELYKASPKDLLCQSLRPAKQICELSPADRLFGWVLQENQKQEKTSENADANSSKNPEKQDQDRSIPKNYKSRIRVVCDDGSRPKIVQRFEGGGSLPLTILGKPKPAQGRFYVAKDKKGTPQHKISKTEAGYKLGKKGKNKSLRGRKQYWHHSGLEAEVSKDKQDQCYWKPSVEDRTFKKRKGRYQEYRRPDILDEKDGRYKPQTDLQNRSITGWIKPGEVFKASLYVQNLQPQEVGVLLWLLTLPDKHYFRLGYGKPLGFGSVRIELDCPNGVLPLGKGEDWKKYYTTLDKPLCATLNEDQQKNCIQKFWDSMVAGYPAEEDPQTKEGEELKEKRFKSLDFIAGFLRVIQGPGDNAPIHYPRLEHPEGQYKPNPEGKNFGWFVDNDHYRDGKKLALPAVTDDKELPNGLPYTPKR